MTLSDLASIATIVNGLAVLGSLLYLAEQTRQNTRHTRALIQQGRNQEVVNFNLAFVTSPAANAILVRGDAADPTLTPAEIYSYFQIVVAQLAHVENIYYQHRDGLVDDERFSGTVAYLQYARATQPGFRAAWQICQVMCGTQFRSFVEAKIGEAVSFPQSDAAAQWRALAKPGGHEGVA